MFNDNLKSNGSVNNHIYWNCERLSVPMGLRTQQHDQVVSREVYRWIVKFAVYAGRRLM